MDDIPDLGARRVSLTLEHSEPDRIAALLRDLIDDRSPEVVRGSQLRYRAEIEMAEGPKQLK